MPRFFRRNNEKDDVAFDEDALPEGNFEDGTVIENDDGSVDVVLDDFIEEINEDDSDHYDNLVPLLDDEALDDIAGDVIEAFEADQESRREWEQTVVDGFNLLGMKLEEFNEPFEGACSAVHPLITESAVKFQARASKELFPANGPVKTQILGNKTEKKEDQSSRIKNHMNYQLTCQMEEYFPDTERMLFYLPIIGSAFKKVYYDQHLNRPVAEFIPVDQFVVANTAVDLRRADRYTHVIYRSENDLKKDIVAGLYEDADVGEPEQPKLSEIATKQREIMGLAYGASEYEEVYTLLEQHTFLDLPGELGDDNGVAMPYVVTVDMNSQKVLSIRRNWKPEDPRKEKRVWFSHYTFVPGFGFYGLGYIHLLGNFQMTLTLAMRSLVDSGQFANLQGGFKARGVKVIGANDPISPGEWRDVEAAGFDLDKALKPLPYKEPSIVLFKMLEFLEARGQKFADTTEQVIADSTNYGPVGTTLALLEASTKFFSGIHKRLHYSQKQEFKILADINHEFLPQEYPYDVVGESKEVFRSDYDGRVDIIPVSDPNVSSNAHRMTLAQTRLQVAQSMPHIVNVKEAVKQFFKAMGQEEDLDVLIPPEEEAQPQDPMTDIMLAVSGKPIKAFRGQDHDAHIQVKQLWLNDPMNGKDPLMQPAVPAIVANIREHMIERYAELMQSQNPESEAAMAIAAQKVAAVNAEEAERAGIGDPLQVAAKAQMLEAETDAKKALHQMQVDTVKLALEAQKLALAEQKEGNRQEEANKKMGLDLVKESMNRVNDLAETELKETLKGDTGNNAE